jgi:hypothetical protein
LRINLAHDTFGLRRENHRRADTGFFALTHPNSNKAGQ